MHSWQSVMHPPWQETSLKVCPELTQNPPQCTLLSAQSQIILSLARCLLLLSD